MIEFGQVHTLITDELVQKCSNYEKIAICGVVNSGKSVIGSLLAEKLDREYLNTDTYELPFKEVPDAVLKDLTNQVVCGVQVPRILRKGLDGRYLPDLVIYCRMNHASLYEIYENSEKDFNRVVGFNKGIEKVFSEWVEKQEQCKIIVLNTSFKDDEASMEFL